MVTRPEESLIILLDDPDNQVYQSVRIKILGLGKPMLPFLEAGLKRANNRVTHERMESLIRTIHFSDLKTDLNTWLGGPEQELLTGVWLLNRYQFPELLKEDLYAGIKPFRDEIWIEISEQLTALEKIAIVNKTIFSEREIALNEQHPESPGNNFLNRILATGKGNEFSITLFYGLICQLLELPVMVVEMPEYPILAYLDLPRLPRNLTNPGLFETLFYINPTNSGTVHAQQDITDYLMRRSIPIEQSFYLPLPNTAFIRICMDRLAMDYELSGSRIRCEEIQQLRALWK